MKRLAPTLLGATLLLIAPAVARAQNVVILDLDSTNELRETAGAVSMLVRSQLGPGQRKLAGDAELILALKLLGTPLRAGDGTVDQATAEKVMERLTADRMFVGTLARVGGRLSVRGQIVGVTGGRLGRVSVDGPAGEIGSLASDLVQRLAARLGMTPAIVLPTVAQGPMRPLVDASAAVVQDDIPAASRHLALADRSVSSKLRATGALAGAVIESDKSSASERVAAALASGDQARALKIADEAIEKTPEDGAAHVARARALAAAGRVTEAEEELKQAGDEPTALVALELALRPGSRRKAQDSEVLKLLAENETFQQTLALIASSPPRALSPKVETAVVAAAERLQPRSAGLASAIGLRAVHGKIELSRAMRLILPQDLNHEQLEAVQKSIEGTPAAAEPSGVKLSAEIVSRDLAVKELRRAQAYQSGDVSPELTAKLTEMLKELPPLADGSVRRVMVAPFFGSGSPPFLPIVVKTEPVRVGLRVALVRLPIAPPSLPAAVAGAAGDGGTALAVASSPGKAAQGSAGADAGADGGAALAALAPAESATRGAIEPLLVIDPPSDKEVDQALASVASMSDMADEGDADSILFYRVRGRMGAVLVELVLFDRDEGKTYEVSRWVSAAELRGWQTAPLVVAGALLLFLFGLVIWRLGRMLGGTILVVLEQDAGAENEMFTIVIDQSQKPPKITSPADYKSEMNRIGETKSRFRATLVGAKTAFAHLPAGSYYVHLYGIYTRGDRVRVLDDFTAKVDVSSRQTASVVFKLAATFVEYTISVFDGETPVPGAAIWIDDQKGAGQVTPESGAVVMQLPKGPHTINMEARGMQASKTLSVLNTKPQKVAFNLVWERKVDKASRALEGLVRPSQAVAAAQAAAAAARKTGDVKTAPATPERDAKAGRSNAVSAKPAGARDQPASLPLSGNDGEPASLPLSGNDGEPASLPLGGAGAETASLPLGGNGVEPASLPLSGNGGEPASPVLDDHGAAASPASDEAASISLGELGAAAPSSAEPPGEATSPPGEHGDALPLSLGEHGEVLPLSLGEHGDAARAPLGDGSASPPLGGGEAPPLPSLGELGAVAQAPASGAAGASPPQEEEDPEISAALAALGEPAPAAKPALGLPGQAPSAPPPDQHSGSAPSPMPSLALPGRAPGHNTGSAPSPLPSLALPGRAPAAAPPGHNTGSAPSPLMPALTVLGRAPSIALPGHRTGSAPSPMPSLGLPGRLPAAAPPGPHTGSGPSPMPSLGLPGRLPPLSRTDAASARPPAAPGGTMAGARRTATPPVAAHAVPPRARAGFPGEDDDAPSIPLAAPETHEPSAFTPPPTSGLRPPSQFAHTSSEPVDTESLQSIPLAGPARPQAGHQPPARPPHGGPPKRR